MTYMVPVGQTQSIERSPYARYRADAVPQAVEGLHGAVRADFSPDAIRPWSLHGALGGCGCQGIRSVGTVDPSGLGTSPDGLGAYSPPLFGSVTGNTLADALLAGGLGYLVSPTKDERALWTAGGAVAGALAGTLGVIAVVGMAFYVRKSR